MPSTDLKLPAAEQRPTNPNVLQQQASDPMTSVWVGASAGSGKTKVLTDRMLRLLLPDANGKPGTQPHKILALTFTKAGASEMSLRISKRLSEWAVMPLETSSVEKAGGLKENLKNLLGHAPSEEQITAARKLFARVVDAPGGLKIMTIHSFCMSLLSRFPLESGLTPSFKELNDSQTQRLLSRARDTVLKDPNTDKGSLLSQAIHNLSIAQNEEQFSKLLENIVKERHQLQLILEKNFGVDGLYNNICQSFGIPAGISAEDIMMAACDNDSFDEEKLWNAAKALGNSDKSSDQKNSIKIQQWLEADKKDRITLYEIYRSAFLTNEITIQKRLATANVVKNNPNILSILENEAQRLLQLEDKFNAIKISTLTRDLFLIGQEILNHYKALKEKESALDFDDLILRTLALLQGRTETLTGLDVTPWIRYKLDQGIDHILVDEAQDTNPEQWGIIQALCDDFFDGTTQDDVERTVFVVGDEKQSIFSFQRARPEKFEEMRQWFSEKIKNGGKILAPVNFITSFRSVTSVLDLVDRVFSTPSMREGLGLENIKHESFYYRRSGLVELWPLFENDEKQNIDPWAPPIETAESSSGAAQLANHIAQTIAGWIKNKELLASYNRPIEAKDILILVRSRTPFLDQIVKSLKDEKIPISGVDRMILSQQLVVQDLCAAAQFALLPEDDLALAGFLKSPFIGWDEDRLFNVAYNRDRKSLWKSIQESGDKKTIQWLSLLIKTAGKDRPYEFFAKILQQPCPADSESGLKAIKKRLGDECLDPLDEFLNNVIEFEKDSIPTLQNFLQAQLYDESEIKRQMEEGGKAVRIMTVHGAKGLQAPIVILPDTAKSASRGKIDNILWPDRSGASLPYFCPTSTAVPDKCRDAFDVLKIQQQQESKRLLYVALTRAEDRLYIAGYKTTKNLPEDSWYHYVQNGFLLLDDVEKIESDRGEILRHTNPEIDSTHNHNEKEKTSDKNKKIPAPDWLHKAMPEEPFPPRPLMPSRPSEKEVSALSPLKSKNEYRFVRGNVTHKLLQILPDLPADKRESAAQKYVAQPAHGLSDKIQKSIVEETLKILNDPKFSAVFGAGSMAEVPITGLMNDKTIISGQIDRLLITEQEILVVDFKTNRPPPQKLVDVPDIYRKQMKAYADALRLIYKDKPIKTALIWTDGAVLMEIPTD